MTDELDQRRKLKRSGNWCQAISKGTGKRCLQTAAAGQRVCHWHGAQTRKTEAARMEVRVRRHIPPPEQWRHLDPLEAADMYRAEADAWLTTIRRELDKLESFEVTSVLNLGDGKTIEKVGAELRAIVVAYTQALDRCFGMAATSVKLGIHQRAVEQLERQSELFARVLAEGMRMLAIDVPPERYAAVVPAAIEAVRAEVSG